MADVAIQKTLFMKALLQDEGSGYALQEKASKPCAFDKSSVMQKMYISKIEQAPVHGEPVNIARATHGHNGWSRRCTFSPYQSTSSKESQGTAKLGMPCKCTKTKGLMRCMCYGLWLTVFFPKAVYSKCRHAQAQTGEHVAHIVPHREDRVLAPCFAFSPGVTIQVGHGDTRETSDSTLSRNMQVCELVFIHKIQSHKTIF